ncbi:hypothetical protein ACIBCT_13645 [Streptosporangium sp. NPDC050855]|uniref:hypothetical protein n=1 Tax=Streptosporangium sp. NPDC050855 TaxID=3366194 RepID=UPI0037BA9AE7
MDILQILLPIAGLVVGVVLMLADPLLLSRVGGERDDGAGTATTRAAGAGGERLSWR